MSPPRGSSYSPADSAFGDFRERRDSCVELERIPVPWAVSFEPQALPRLHTLRGPVPKWGSPTSPSSPSGPHCFPCKLVCLSKEPVVHSHPPRVTGAPPLPGTCLGSRSQEEGRSPSVVWQRQAGAPNSTFVTGQHLTVADTAHLATGSGQLRQ